MVQSAVLCLEEEWWHCITHLPPPKHHFEDHEEVWCSLLPVGSSTSQNLCCPHSPIKFVGQICISPPHCWALLSWPDPGLLRCICTTELSSPSSIYSEGRWPCHPNLSKHIKYLLEMVLSSSQSMSGNMHSAQQSITELQAMEKFFGMV